MYSGPVITDHDGVLAELPDVPDLLRQHPQFLKVDEAVDLRLVPVKEKGEVFLDDGEERDEGRVGGSLELSVLGHVVEWVHVTHQVLQYTHYAVNSVGRDACHPLTYIAPRPSLVPDYLSQR